MKGRDLILETILRIPEGRVATYGQVARAAGLPGRARLVGQALRGLGPESIVPWQRVVGAGGRLSIPSAEGAALQRSLLEDEGVRFSGRRVDLDSCLWNEGQTD